MVSNKTKFDLKPFIRHAPVVFLTVFLSLLIISVLILSWVPPVSKDALTHHLAVPKLYLQRGAIYEISAIPHSYYPMNLDLLYIMPLFFGNDIIPKYIHFSFALFTAFLIFKYLKQRIDMVYALVGVVFFLSLPIIVKLSITVYVDLGLIFFSTASLIYLFRWFENRFELKFLMISAIWCGLALGTKYIGLIVFFLLSMFVPVLYLRVRHADGNLKSGERSNPVFHKKKMNASIQLRAFGYGTIFMVVALLVFSPWMIRNYIWTNNPIYPLYDKWFNPPIESSSTTSEADQKTFLKKMSVPLSHFSIRRINYGESGWEIALVPVRVFFQGKDGNPQYFDGKLSPFLLLLPIFAFYRKGANNSLLMTEKKALFAFSILLLLFVYFQNQMRIRWIAPIIPPLIILSMFGLKEIGTIFTARDSAKSVKMSAGITGVIILAAMIMNAVYVLEQFKYVNPFEYISGRVGRDDYVERYIDEYPTLKYANRTLPQEARILSLFLGNRYYYSDREMIFDELIFRNAVVGAKSVQDISPNLRKKGITHLLVRYDLFVDWSEVNFSNRQKDLIKTYFKEQVRLLYSKNGYGLYNL